MTEKNGSCCFKTSIGGQALMEGILMRGPEKQSIVCRLADGTLETKIEDVKAPPKTPFLRGIYIFISSLANGMRALSYSAGLQPEESWTNRRNSTSGWKRRSASRPRKRS